MCYHFASVTNFLILLVTSYFVNYPLVLFIDFLLLSYFLYLSEISMFSQFLTKLLIVIFLSAAFCFSFYIFPLLTLPLIKNPCSPSMILLSDPQIQAITKSTTLLLHTIDCISFYFKIPMMHYFHQSKIQVANKAHQSILSSLISPQSSPLIQF